MKREKDGYITLYLALTLGVMLSLIFALIEGVRMQTIRMEIEGVMDIGLYSIFGEYNRQLLEQYDLFFIDTTYGQGDPSVKNTEEHLQYFMNQNFEKEAADFLSYRDLTDLHCDNVTLEGYQLASDHQGQVLKEQIVEYMKSRTGITLAEDVAYHTNLIRASNLDSRSINDEWDKAHKEIDRLVEEKNQQIKKENEEGNEATVTIDNPADSVRESRGKGILQVALPAGKTVSAMEIYPEYYFSHRQPLQGKGQIEEEESLLEQTAGRIFLQEYLFEKCGFYGQALEKGALEYQLEYILKRRSRDDENLQEVLKDILHIRQAANTLYLFSSQEKQTQAGLLASALTALLLMPELEEVVKYSLLFAWGYAESVKDLHILLDGNKVPLFKDDASWNTPLLHLANFTSHLDEYHSSEQGFSYQNYLEVFLYMESEEKVLEGFMDICEMDIRLTSGNEYFRIDGCVKAVKAKANISSKYGYGYDITRSFSY